jgi:kinesin family protein 4/21/27|tara:strand:- start:5332 stop:5808 length:477 start_codon:yes stop_codon:yes gene_type:complete
MEGYKYKVEQPGKAPQAQFECGENEGIVPRSVRLLFDLIKQQSNLQKKKFTVYCSYLQVYKEKIYDLLNKSHVKGVVADGPGLKLKWSKNDVFSVENLYTFECKTVDDVMALYHFGIKNKVVASHNMNNSSSRSHSMLSLTVEQVEVSNLDNVVVSKL